MRTSSAPYAVPSPSGCRSPCSRRSPWPGPPWACRVTRAAEDGGQERAPRVVGSALLGDVPLGRFSNALLPGSVADDRGVDLGGIGSDIYPAGRKGEFWTVTDRGPNGQIKVDGKKRRDLPRPRLRSRDRQGPRRRRPGAGAQGDRDHHTVRQGCHRSVQPGLAGRGSVHVRREDPAHVQPERPRHRGHRACRGRHLLARRRVRPVPRACLRTRQGARTPCTRRA